MSSVGVQRVTSQMIPTPGFSVSNNHSYTNMDPSSNNCSFSGVDSTLLLPSQSQPQRHQKLQDSDHNNHALHNLGSQIDGGRRSDLLQNTFAYPNGSINSGLGLIGNSIQIANELGTEDYTSAYSNSPKNLQQLFDQNQQPVVQGNISYSFCLILWGVKSKVFTSFPALPSRVIISFSCVVVGFT